MRRALLLCAVLIPGSSTAYWAENHTTMNTTIFTESRWPQWKRVDRSITNADQYLSQVLYLNAGADKKLRGVPFQPPACFLNTCTYSGDKPTDAPRGEGLSAVNWNAEGGRWEDGFRDYKEASRWAGLRAVNHFHTPYGSRKSDGAYSGITPNAANGASHQPYIDLLRSGISATEWALGAESGGDTNYWSWKTVGESTARFYTDPNATDRQRSLAAALRALGQVQHLVEDNTVPDHARDLPHPGDGYEEYVLPNIESLVSQPASSWTTFPLKYIEEGGLRALWDRDVYSGNPGVTLSSTSPPGISEYTQANFLAWNIKDEFAVFSTVPFTWNVGFDRFPWPRYQPPLLTAGFYGVAVPGGEPISKLMHFEQDHLTTQPNDVDAPNLAALQNRVDAVCWAEYAPPLLRHALGYARSLLALAMQPARAEVVPDPSEPLTHAKIRLWNLAPADSPYAVTWRIDEVQLVALNPSAGPGAPANEPITVTFSGDTVVAPGAMVTSQSFLITPRQRGVLSASSYSAVVVKAHLGTMKQTPLTFGVPIPNGYPVVKQLDLADLTTPATVTSSCDSTPCGDETMKVSVRQPFDQSLSLRVKLYEPWVDVLGEPADARVRAATGDDVRIAGLAVGSWIASGGSLPDFAAPRWPATPTFAAAPAGLEYANTARFFRGEGAPDQKQGDEIPLDLTLHLAEFIRADGDALQSSASTHLAIWTTSGALYLVRLVLWPLTSNDAASKLANDLQCNAGDLPVASLSIGGCVSPSTAPMCTMGPSRQYSFARVTAPWVGVGGFTAGSTPDFGGASVSGSNTLKLETLAGMRVATAPLGGIEAVCTPQQLSSSIVSRTTFTCNPGPGGVAITSAYSDGPAICPTTAAPALQYAATFKPRYPADLDLAYWNSVFGRTDAPPDFTLQAH